MDENYWENMPEHHRDAWLEVKRLWSPEVRAQAVLDEMLRFLAMNPHTDDQTAKSYIAQREVVDDAIARELNSDTIWTFISLASKLLESERASINAAKRHAENRSMKAEVFLWLDANMPKFKSMDAAATVISNTVCPVTFRTARDWVGDWKKLRYAGTP